MSKNIGVPSLADYLKNNQGQKDILENRLLRNIEQGREHARNFPQSEANNDNVYARDSSPSSPFRSFRSRGNLYISAEHPNGEVITSSLDTPFTYDKTKQHSDIYLQTQNLGCEPEDVVNPESSL